MLMVEISIRRIREIDRLITNIAKGADFDTYNPKVNELAAERKRVKAELAQIAAASEIVTIHPAAIERYQAPSRGRCRGRGTRQARARRNEGSGTICAITAASHAAVIKHFDELFGRTARGRPLVLGNNHSESRNVSNVIRHLQPEVATIKRALSDPKSAFSGQSNAKSRAQSRLIIVSRAESAEDQTLAKLIIAAHEQSALLVLLHDQSKQNGIVSHRLAAYAADRLATVEEFSHKSYAETLERLLGAGLIGSAIQSLAEHRNIIFKTIEDPEETEFDFLVCNDSVLAGKGSRTRSARDPE